MSTGGDPTPVRGSPGAESVDPRAPQRVEIDSPDYHDYVFRDGKLIGEFDQMYRKAREVPWHQDRVREQLDCRIAATLLRHHGPFASVLEVGCGMGYFADMVAEAVSCHDVLGIDVAAEAVERARRLFPRFRFEVHDIARTDAEIGRVFDLVVVRGLFWYVFPHLATVVRNLTSLTATRGQLFVAQNFPPLESAFVGKHIIPDPDSLITRFAEGFDIIERLSLQSPALEQVNEDWVMFLARKK
jgi:SAM-dependent methyltransferase